MVKHSFILELKYLKADASDADTQSQWRDAEEQIRRYAAEPKVGQMTAGTNLHPVIMQFKGYKLLRYSEVSA